MINFIIVDDLNFWINCVEDLINKVLFNSNLNYKIHKFNDYNDDFYNVVLASLENKVYILDIETENENGIDVARKIRNTDKQSEIIFLTAYSTDEYISKFLKNSIRALAFIDKNEIDILNDLLKDIIKKSYFFLFKVKTYNIIQINNTSSVSSYKKVTFMF